jgi:multidrug efflux pump
VISGFVALTLTPMLCAKILRVPQRHGPLYRVLEHGFNALASAYSRTLRTAIRYRWVVVAAVVLLTIGAGVVFRTLKREFVPPEDKGWFFSIIIAPEGSSLAYTDGYQRRAEAVLDKTKDVASYFSVVNIGDGVSRGMIFTNLVDFDQRTRSIEDIVGEVQGGYFAIPGVFAFANNPPAFGFGSPVQFVMQNPDFDLLVKGNDTMLARARQVKGLLNVDSDLRVNKPELTVNFDRDRAEDLGVPVGDVATTLQVLLGGNRTSTFTRNNKQYDVIVQLDPRARATPSDMTGLYVRGRDNALVKLEAVASIREGVGPRELNHFNRVRASTLTASLAPGFTLGEAIDSLNRIAAEVLPKGSSTALAGESRELDESGSSLYFAFLLALLVVFMVLASQFESLVHPFTVLLAVPLAVTGALFTLKLAGATLNLYSQIGMILLIGLVTKNSILLVEYINQLKERGLSTVEAALESGRIRLRPILMTSVSTVMGAVPIAFGLGAGSISRRPLGYAIVGGVLFSTLLTLYVVPAVYVILDGLRSRVTRGAHASHGALAAAEGE